MSNFKDSTSFNKIKLNSMARSRQEQYGEYIVFNIYSTHKDFIDNYHEYYKVITTKFLLNKKYTKEQLVGTIKNQTILPDY
jgi:hypothetical protein